LCLDYLALQPTSSVNGVLVERRTAPFGATSMVMGTAYHNVPNGGSARGYLGIFSFRWPLSAVPVSPNGRSAEPYIYTLPRLR
jgi:hypothetical protein